MITLFVIVVIATFALAAPRAEGMRPLGLALVGMISLVLGTSATAIFTESSLAPWVNSVVCAQEANSDEANSDEANSDKANSDEANSDEANSDEAKPDEAKPDEPAPGKTGEAIADSPKLGHPMTVEAITNVQYLDRGENTPGWLETAPWTKDGVHFVPVVSRLQISEPDRDAALDKEIRGATYAYVNQLLKNKHASSLLNMHSGSTVPKVTESFEEQVVVTAGTMYQSHALLAFDDNFREAIAANWDEVRAASRLMQTGLGAGIVILLLSTMFSYFKLDTATRGYYTGRLQFAAAAAILAVVAASVLFANYVPWM